MTTGRTSGSSRSEMIKKLRTQLGLTQEQFAARVGVTFSMANRWEAGRSRPSPLAWREIERLSRTVRNARR
ncbi:MAG: helix-turn-helix domain-containing protein [candidate division Zixibacteria bacterium]|nr:helix-turn-helix domain-containing protein [Gammaproteobacteria bacterium]NIX58643.1 helix-turn-helix domain-containing protein [candidate division Zixibacteria bacterium]